MPHSRRIGLLVLLAPPRRADGFLNGLTVCTRKQVDKLNEKLAGRVLDYTANHGDDRRIWSAALGEKRDVYVYLPPGYDGRTPFPVMFWFHGFGQDERNFLHLSEHLDEEIRTGKMPPLIIVCPDGTVRGRPTFANSGSFYINTRSGRFEDYVIGDVWAWVKRSFCVHPDRGAHVFAAGSMGGFAAFNLGFKHRDEFGVLAGFMPPLDLRYMDCRGRYFADYDPDCIARRERVRPTAVVGRFYTVVLVRERRLITPLVGPRDPDAIPFLARENPVEMLDAYEIRPGEFEMFVGIARKDEFNLDAQADHFVDRAARRGLTLTVQDVPDGNHRTETGVRMLPSFSAWLTQKVGPYSPGGVLSPVPLPPLELVPASAVVPTATGPRVDEPPLSPAASAPTK